MTNAAARLESALVKLATGIDVDLIKPQADGETVCIAQRHDEPQPLELTPGYLRELVAALREAARVAVPFIKLKS